MSAWSIRSTLALAPILADVRAKIAAGELAEARAMVKAAYPFGSREYWPYKVWCSVVRRYLPGLYPRKPKAGPGPGEPLFPEAQ